jgi:hypothetical protein
MSLLEVLILLGLYLAVSFLLGGAPQGTSLLGYILAATDCLICTGQDGLCASARCLTGAGPSYPPALEHSNLHPSNPSLCHV